jgi:hypothetical protein
MRTVTALGARGMGFALYVVGGWVLVTQLVAGGVAAPAAAAERPLDASERRSPPPYTAYHSMGVVIAISSLDDPKTLACATTADRVSTDVLVVHDIDVPVVYRELGCTPTPFAARGPRGAAP